MNDREQKLALVVGALLAGFVIWTGFGKYQKALSVRNNQIDSLQTKQQQLVEQRLQGEYANRQMGEYMARSLPSDPERAQSKYQQWLLGIVQQNQLSNASVDANSSRTIGGLYQLIDFKVQGNADLPSLVHLLHDFYAKDFLHRIRGLSIRPSKGGGFKLVMSVDAIALQAASNDLPERNDPSWRVDGDFAAYLDAIMNRNLYEPPNEAPRYNGQPEVEAIVGRESPVPLTFKDPEGHTMRFEFVEPPPEFVQLDPGSGTLKINSGEKQEFDLVVRVIDGGYPRRTTEQKIRVKIVDPPAAPADKLAFDDATQTVLTALVHGRDEWTAWMHVRTRDKTLRLKVGDGFEIGSLKGSVVEVTPRFVTLEIDGRRFDLRPAGNLSEAANRAAID